MGSSPKKASNWTTLRNGRRVFVRSVRPSDAGALVSFHESLSDESKRLRFFTPHPSLTESELVHFTTVDHENREALVALSLGRIVAVGRFDRTGEHSAEVAFAVADEWQSFGLATQLLDRLGDLAGEQHVTHLEAEVMGENHKMLQVFAHWAPSKTLRFDHGVVHVDMPLPGGVPS